MNTDFEWLLLTKDEGNNTRVAFIKCGALVRCREWTRDGETVTDAVALVFIPGATRADFFKDDK